jgi:molybdate transport system permease protein
MDDALFLSLEYRLLIAFYATAFCTWIGIPLALFLSFKKGIIATLGSSLNWALLIFPPSLLVALIAPYINHTIPIALHHTEPYTFILSLLSASLNALPFMILFSQLAFKQIPISFITIARLADHSYLSIFFKLILPLSYHGIAIGLLISFSRALGDVFIIESSLPTLALTSLNTLIVLCVLLLNVSIENRRNALEYR